ncbi:hypothetical protein [Cohnella sp. WQ 127256]|uniref:hypothetical protein n=1 Tax=Cohnella sp. WQ 127256 TaxID=2938790 RepID=UPI0021173DD8|nr:hypothetical protein [Cohnella sp. WQ 127256]
MSPNKLKQQLSAIPIPSGIRQKSQLGIEQAMLEQQEDSRRKNKRVRRRVGAIVAALALIFLSTDLMNHNYVWASIQKALQFVPGIGIVKEEDSSSERYVLKQPISLNVGEGSIMITGILSDEDMTYITMVGKNTQRFESITLVSEQGAEYNLRSSTASWSSTEWTSGFWHKGKLNIGGENIKLIFPLEPTIEVPITLAKAETVSSYQDMGETATANGVSITAIADRVGEQARISFVARHSEDFDISDYGIYGVHMHDESQKLYVLNDTGKKVEIEHIRGVSSPASEFYFGLSGKAGGHYTLSLPEISVTYKDEVSIKVSTEAKQLWNQTFEIAGFPVTITRIEKLKENGLRVYMDFHYNEEAPASLYNLDIEGFSNVAKLNERTGAIDYIEFEVEPGSKQVNLKLIRPGVIMRGPWQFEFAEESFKVGK